MNESRAARLVLGTAQLGMPYGIHNLSGQPSSLDASEMVREAWTGGIREFDTAQAYGASEEVLGNAFVGLGIENDVRVLTKMDPRLDLSNRGALDAALQRSLKQLRIKKLKGFMLHHEGQLDHWTKTFHEWLTEKRLSEVVGSIGASLYTPSKALEALKMNEIQFIQVPANICDRRFEDAGVFALAESLQKIVYIRSIYLQGLFFMLPENVPGSMGFATKTLQKVRSLAQAMNLSIEDMCLGYVIHRWPKARIIFGAETREQIARNLFSCAQDFSSAALERIEQELMDCEERVGDPSQWPKQVAS